MRPIGPVPSRHPRPMRVSALATLTGLLLSVIVPGSTTVAGIGVTVTTGTTIVPPPAIELGGSRGDRLASVPVPLAWWTNDEAMAIVTISSDLLCQDASCGAPDAPESIRASAVSLRQLPGTDSTLDRTRILTILGSAPSETPFTMVLTVEVALPDVRPGRYTGSLRFGVVDPSAGDRSTQTEVFGAPARTASAPDGSPQIATDVVVIVSP